MTVYPPDFYEKLQDNVRRSAEVVVPLVMDLVQPRTVLDIGCGLGTWLDVFLSNGAAEVLGVDGAYIDVGKLEIPQRRFVPYDLKEPLQLKQRFDLVMSLEVAEHLPEACAETFVDSLTRHGPVILFSAAIPFQQGRHHVNEQWPAYWAEHFHRNGYVAIDCLRTLAWNDNRVEWWYAQNMLLFVSRASLPTYPALSGIANGESLPLSLVHPSKYLATIDALRQCMEGAWRMKFELAVADLQATLPLGTSLILVDQGELPQPAINGHTVFRFLQQDDRYGGLPADDDAAIRELRRLDNTGASCIAFAWPAFWWLDHYTGLAKFLNSNYQCILKNDRLIVFARKT